MTKKNYYKELHEARKSDKEFAFQHRKEKEHSRPEHKPKELRKAIKSENIHRSKKSK